MSSVFRVPAWQVTVFIQAAVTITACNDLISSASQQNYHCVQTDMALNWCARGNHEKSQASPRQIPLLACQVTDLYTVKARGGGPAVSRPHLAFWSLSAVCLLNLNFTELLIFLFL